jgi:hypothetical protein
MTAFLTRARWHAERHAEEDPILTIHPYSMVSGREDGIEVELGSETAKFALDIHRFEHGFVSIATGSYDSVMAPYTSPIPRPKEGMVKPKPGFSVIGWNPLLAEEYGEVEFQASAGLFGSMLEALFLDAWRCPEFAEGKVPVIWFTGAHERPFPAHGAVYLAPDGERIGWLPRQMIEPFASLEPTVQPPQLRLEAAKISFAQLGRPQESPVASRSPKVTIIQPAARKPTITVKRPTMKRGDDPTPKISDDDISDVR